MSINFSAFLDSLTIMLSVMLVLYAVIILLGKAFAPKK